MSVPVSFLQARRALFSLQIDVNQFIRTIQSPTHLFTSEDWQHLARIVDGVERTVFPIMAAKRLREQGKLSLKRHSLKTLSLKAEEVCARTTMACRIASLKLPEGSLPRKHTFWDMFAL